MGDRRWNPVGYSLEPEPVQLFFQFTVGTTGAPTFQQFNYFTNSIPNRTGLYVAAPLPGASNLYGTQAGARGIKSVVRNNVGLYQINLSQSFTRFLQGQVSFKTLGTSVYPNVTFPYPESTLRLPVSQIASAAPSSTFTVAAVGVPGATETGNAVTITTTAPHGFLTNQLVQISGVNITGPVATGLSNYNGVYSITSVPTTTTFTYFCPENGLANGGGGTAQVLGASPGPFITMQFLNPTSSAVIELASGDIVVVQLVFALGTGS